MSIPLKRRIDAPSAVTSLGQEGARCNAARNGEKPREHARVISGFVHPDFGGVTQALRSVATHKRGGGAAVAVYHRGELVVDAWTGARDAWARPGSPTRWP